MFLFRKFCPLCAGEHTLLPLHLLWVAAAAAAAWADVMLLHSQLLTLATQNRLHAPTHNFCCPPALLQLLSCLVPCLRSCCMPPAATAPGSDSSAHVTFLCPRAHHTCARAQGGVPPSVADNALLHLLCLCCLMLTPARSAIRSERRCGGKGSGADSGGPGLPGGHCG